MKARSVTVIGGGTGSFHVLLGLRRIGVWPESIVAMTDSGGDSGELRDAFGVLPPGDLRRCLVALSEESQLLRDLFSFRFDEPPLRGRNFGNLFILALTKALGSEPKAIEAMERILKIRGRVIPVTWDNAHVVAELEDGHVIHGEANIDCRECATRSTTRGYIPIKHVRLEPHAQANPDAIAAIERNDCIVLAPGDMYTSTLPNLLVGGIADAIQKSPAPLVYVLNLMTKYGETHGWTASRHVAEIARYGGRVPDAVLAHEGPVQTEVLARYLAEKAYPVELDLDSFELRQVAIVRTANIASKDSLVRHDPLNTARALMTLIDDLYSR
ncbi:MAG: gluconeogenesis factor YvcK family protein, partial [Gammaproteobacteria bacterium]